MNSDHFTTIKWSTGKLWVLAFIWLPLDTNHNITADKVHPVKVTSLVTSLIAVVPSAGQYGKYTRTHQEKLLSSRHLAMIQIPQIPIWPSIRGTCWNKSSPSLVISVKWDPNECQGRRFPNRTLHCGNKVINVLHLTGQLKTRWQQHIVTPAETSEAVKLWKKRQEPNLWTLTEGCYVLKEPNSLGIDQLPMSSLTQVFRKEASQGTLDSTLTLTVRGWECLTT